MKKSLFLFSLFSFSFSLPFARAHCPLCTVGAAAAAGGALWLGVDLVVIALFIGAFGVSTGWWISRLVKRTFFRGQKGIIIIASFLLTIIPLMPLFPGITPYYLSWSGEYGSLLNRTYLFNTFLMGSIFGGAVVSLTPFVSRKITAMRGKMVPFQGVILTLALLILVGIGLQVA